MRWSSDHHRADGRRHQTPAQTENCANARPQTVHPTRQPETRRCQMPPGVTLHGEQRRQEILDFILNYEAQHGYTPAIREISMGVNLCQSGVFSHLKILQRQGKIGYGDNRRRTIAPLVGAGSTRRLVLAGSVADFEALLDVIGDAPYSETLAEFADQIENQLDSILASNGPQREAHRRPA